MSCHEHGPEQQAKFFCVGCGRAWCPECVLRPEEHEHVTTALCAGCHGILRALRPTDQPLPSRVSAGAASAGGGAYRGEYVVWGDPVEEARQAREALTMGAFVQDLLWGLVAPLRSMGGAVAVVLVTLYVMLLHAWGSVWAIVFSIIGLGLYTMYLSNLLEYIGRGIEESPGIDWDSSMWFDGLMAGLRTMLLVGLCFGLGLYLWSNLAEIPWLSWGVLLSTTFVFPVMWLGSCLTRSMAGIFHPLWGVFIKRAFIPYTMVYGAMLGVLMLVMCIIDRAVYHDQGKGFLIVYPLFFYFLYVITYILGKLVYYHHDIFDEGGVL